jgi:hypothetical protein
MTQEIKVVDVGKIKFQWKGTYDTLTSYEPDDIVSFNDGVETSSYISVFGSTGQSPGSSGVVNSTYWNLFAEGAPGNSAGTANGQVQYKNTTGFAATSNLFWDSSNNRLGINTNVPKTSLDVIGILSATNFDSSYSTYLSSFDFRANSGTAVTFSNRVNIQDTFKPKSGIVEKVNIVNGTANATSDIDVNTAQVWYFNTASTNDWTHNIRGDGSTSLNSLLSTGDNISVCVISTQNNSLYGSVNLNIDGSGQTIYWINNNNKNNLHGSSGYDIYTWNITKTGSSSYVVVASSDNYR